MNIFKNSEDIKHFSTLKVWGDASIDQLFREKSKNNPEKIGISGYSICDDQQTTFENSRVQTIVDKISQQLLFSGLNSGDVIAVQLPNSVETHIFFLACWQRGITVAPLPTLWCEKDIKQALIRISPQAYICPTIHDGFNFAELMYQIAFDISSIKMLFSLGGNAVDGCVSLDEFFTQIPTHAINLLGASDAPQIDANSACLITFAKDENGVNSPFYHTHNHLIAAANIYNSLAKPDINSKLCTPFSPTSLVTCAISTVSWLVSEAELICYDGFMATEFQNIQIKDAILCLPRKFDEPNLIEALFEQGLKKLTLLGKIDAGFEPQYMHSQIIDVTTFNEFAFLPQIRSTHSKKISANQYNFSLTNAITDSITLAEYQTSAKQAAWQISCSFLPVNVVKTEFSFKSSIACGSSSQTTSSLNIGNMAANYADIESELAKFHGIEEAAILIIEDSLLGHKPIIAVVPKVGAVILHHEIVEFLKNKNIASYLIPQELYKIPNIPRDFDNQIIRLTSKQELFNQVAPKNGPAADGLLAVQQELASLLASGQ